MRKIDLGKSGLLVPAIGLGCMRISGMEVKEASELIYGAMELGVNFFDHADIYGGGKSEELFAKAVGMSTAVREKMILQSKCGIRRGYYDFSKEHILNSVDGILKRLNTEYIDILLLHRPDTLMEPEEVAEAFDELHNAGKVKYFGVSNQNPMQMELLSKYVGHKLLVNQLQLSVTNSTMMDSGIFVNTESSFAPSREGSILEYCRLKDITIQAWSPFQYGFFQGVFLGNENYPDLNRVINELADKYGVTDSAIAIAWILRHPANIQPIVGTTNLNRLTSIAEAADVTLTREEWYMIYKSVGKQLP